HRNRHIVQPGCIDENIGLVVIAAEFLTGSYSREGHHPIQPESLHQAANLGFQRTFPHQIEACVRKCSLNLGEGTHHYIQAVIRMKSARADKMRTHWIPLPE